MRTVFTVVLLIATAFAASAQDASDGASVESQPGSTSTYRVRVMANYPGATVTSGDDGDAKPSDPVGSGSVVTIEEFPGIGSGSGGGSIVSESLDARGGAEPRVLATLYGVPITEDEVAREMWERRGRETFEWILGREILKRELRRLRLDVSDAEVKESLDKHLAVLRRAYPNLKKTDDLTRAASGMPLDEYRERTVWAELALRKIMNSALETRDEDLRKFFATVRADYIRPERVRVSQIFISPKADDSGGVADASSWERAEGQINEAHALLLRGEDFDKVARTFGSGGRLSRWVKRGDLLRELEDPVFAIKPVKGDETLTPPIKSSIGWHILLIEEREDRAEPTLDDVRDEIRSRYEEERFVRLAGEFMARLKEKTLETGGLVIVDVPSVFADENARGND